MTAGTFARMRSPRARRSLQLVALVLGAGASLCAAPVAAADPAAATTTLNPNYQCAPGTWTQYYVVPTDPPVTWLVVEARGGAGGYNGNTGPGGQGGSVTAPVPVTPGETLAVNVGIWGNAHGGCGMAPGGQRGTNSDNGPFSGGSGKTSWGGGSGTLVWRYGAPAGTPPLLIAGGGGGGGGKGGDNEGSRNGGGTGGNGDGSRGENGHGSDSGVGGCGACDVGYAGGKGNDSSEYAGAGGGGGGGAVAGHGGGVGRGGDYAGGGGGGGGSSLASDTLHATFGTSDYCPPPGGAAACDGSVTFSYDTNPSTIAISGGDDQDTMAGGVFAQPLSVVVKNAEGQPLQGAVVTFALPGVGPSGTFTSGNATTAQATTDVNGLAVSPTFQATATAGLWRPKASLATGSSVTFGSIVNTKAPTVTHLTTSVPTAVAGEPVTFEARVAVGTAPVTNFGGTIQFEVDGAPLGSPVEVSADGVADSRPTTFGLDGSPVGDHPVKAIYQPVPGDPNHLPSQSTVLTQHVRAASTATSITSTPRVSTTGQSVSVTARVTAEAAAGGAVPTGTVDLYAAPFPGGTPAPIASGVALDATGSATFVAGPFMLDGAYDLRVVYGGSTGFATSTGTAVQSVGASATATLLTSSVNPSVYGQHVTLSATVARAGTGVAPHGAVSFAAGGVTLCVAVPIAEDDDPTDGDGVATCAVGDGALSTRANPITASFVDPDGTYDPSTGSMAQQVVAAVSTTSLTAIPAAGVFGADTRLRAVVAAQEPGEGLPTGTVQFTVDDVAAGLPVPVVRGVATSAPLAGLTVGVHRLTASFEDDGDPDDFRPSSGALTYHVAAAPTTLTITSDAEPAPGGQPVVLTAHAVAAGDAGMVTGEVQFLVDGAASGAPVPMVDGSAQLRPLALTEGTHAVVARLQGGSRFAPALASFTQRVTAAPPAPPAPVAPTPGANAGPPKVSLETSRVTASGDGIVNVVLGCTGQSDQRCSGTLDLTSATRLPSRLIVGKAGRGWTEAGVSLGTEPYSLAAGELHAVQVPLTPAARRVLVDRGTAALTVSAHPGAAGASTEHGPLTVLASRAPAVWIDPRRVLLGSGGTVALRVRCDDWARCDGRLALSATTSARTLGSARLAVAGGTVRTVRVRLDARTRRAITAHGSQALVVRATTALPAGRPTLSKRRVTVTTIRGRTR